MVREAGPARGATGLAACAARSSSNAPFAADRPSVIVSLSLPIASFDAPPAPVNNSTPKGLPPPPPPPQTCWRTWMANVHTFEGR